MTTNGSAGDAATPEQISQRDLARPDLVSVISTARVIAVIGVSQKPDRPAFYVPDYLHKQGYRIIPVNATAVGATMWGEPVRATLAEIREPVDIVDVFRRSEDVPQHVDDILAMQPLPKTVWLQLGIRNDTVAQTLIRAGIAMVQDRCLLVDHRDLVGRPVR